MKSKQILPEEDRLTKDHLNMVPPGNKLIVQYHEALIAAEKEMQEKERNIAKVLTVMASALETVQNLKDNDLHKLAQDLDKRREEIQGLSKPTNPPFGQERIFFSEK